MALLAGLDIGSAFSKAVIMEEGRVLAHDIRPTEGNFERSATRVLDEVFRKTGRSMADIAVVGACGVGVSFLPWAVVRITEISCHARGVHAFLPTVRTLIEVGNQSSRVTKISPGGLVADCLVSDKCAAGSGRILEVIAKVLQIDPRDMGRLSEASTSPARFTTGCTVFLETEAISRVAEGASKADIVAGLHQALSIRTVAMVQRIKPEADFAITGGGACDSGLVRTMTAKLGHPVLVPDEPLITGAIGAALVAAEKRG